MTAHPHRRGAAAGGTPAVLPAAALVAAVEARCRARGTNPYRLLADQRAQRAYYRARAGGVITLPALEGLCDRLGWHPRELYGDAYDQAVFAGSIWHEEEAC